MKKFFDVMVLMGIFIVVGIGAIAGGFLDAGTGTTGTSTSGPVLVERNDCVRAIKFKCDCPKGYHYAKPSPDKFLKMHTYYAPCGKIFHKIPTKKNVVIVQVVPNDIKPENK